MYIFTGNFVRSQNTYYYDVNFRIIKYFIAYKNLNANNISSIDLKSIELYDIDKDHVENVDRVRFERLAKANKILFTKVVNENRIESFAIPVMAYKLGSYLEFDSIIDDVMRYELRNNGSILVDFEGNEVPVVSIIYDFIKEGSLGDYIILNEDYLHLGFVKYKVSNMKKFKLFLCKNVLMSRF